MIRKKTSPNIQTKAFRFRLEPRKWQRTLFNRYAGSCRYIYNYGLSLFREAFENGQIVSYEDLCKKITLLKSQQEMEWLAEAPSQTLQQALKDLSEAIRRFLKRDSSGKKLEFPKFQKKGQKDSFRYPQGMKTSDDKVFLPKIGWVRYRASRPLKGTVAQVTIKREGDHWFVAFTCHLHKEIPIIVALEKNLVGIDVGIKNLAVLSTGEVIENPHVMKKKLQKLAKEQRILSHKQTGSSNYKKQVKKIARIHIDIKNTRKDYLHKVSSALVKNHDAFAVEDLNISGMIRNRKLSRSIADVSWRMLISMLEYKAKLLGKQLVKVGRFLPTSKTCSFCQAKQDMPLSMRIYRCSACGLIIDRDLNASINIRAAVIVFKVKFLFYIFCLRQALLYLMFTSAIKLRPEPKSLAF